MPRAGETMVRLKPDFHKKLLELAKSEKRTLGAQVEWLYEKVTGKKVR